MFNIIVATDLKNGIGYKNTLPWHIPEDLKYFKDITIDSIVIMGRKTWMSLPKKPLPGRINIVVTSSKIDSVICADSFEKALSLSSAIKKEVFVIGGSQLYQEAIKHPECFKIYRTLIYKEYTTDTFFNITPDYYLIDSSIELKSSEIKYVHEIYQRI